MMAYIRILAFLVCAVKVFAQAPDTLWTSHVFSLIPGDAAALTAVEAFPNNHFVVAGNVDQHMFLKTVDPTGLIVDSIFLAYPSSGFAQTLIRNSPNSCVAGGTVEGPSVTAGWIAFQIDPLTVSSSALLYCAQPSMGRTCAQTIGINGATCCSGWETGNSSVNWFVGTLGDVGPTWTTCIEEGGYDIVPRASHGIITTEDGDIVSTTGGTSSGMSVVKLAAETGYVEWQRYFFPNQNVHPFGMTACRNGGFAISAGYESPPRLMRFSASGDLLWTQFYDPECGTQPMELIELQDCGFVWLTEGGCVTRTDSLGIVLWTRQYCSNGIDIARIDDGGFAVVCAETLVRTEPDPVNYRIWVNSPNGGEDLGILRSHLVSWTTKYLDEPLVIEINRDFPGAHWEVLADSVDDDGSDSVFVTGPVSANCRLRVRTLSGSYADTSDTNFNLSSSEGYLAAVHVAAQSIPLITWTAGALECQSTSNEILLLKNFGSEPIVVFPPLEPTSPEFSITTTCGSFFALAPSGISACSLTVSFSPTGEGIFHDTLRIQTDAVNGVGGYVSIPLSGSQIRTPESPEVVISTVGNNAVLRWSPIVESIGHCQIDPPSYLVFFAENNAGPFWFHGVTADTMYTHVGAVQYALAMFYHVYAVANVPEYLLPLPPSHPESPIPETEVLSQISRQLTFTGESRSIAAPIHASVELHE